MHCHPPRKPQRGFTLLEMLVVMVLMGLVTTLALPAMQRWHDAVQAKAQAASIVDALRAASFEAGATRRELVVDERSFDPAVRALRDASQSARSRTMTSAEPASTAAGDSENSDEGASSAATATAATVGPGRVALTLPPGWRSEAVSEIRFLANGLCSPGSIRLRTARGDTVAVAVRGPLCGVDSTPLAETPRS